MATPTTRVYIVCHKTSYAHLADAADDRLRWYVVNEAIPDKTIHAPPASVVREWDLPCHEPGLQAAGAREASAIFHALANPAELLDADYVGFAQYDMAVPSAALDAFEAAAAADPAVVGVGFARPWSELLSASALPASFWDELLAAFGATRRPAEVPLFGAFVLPRAKLVEMAARVNAIAPDLHAVLGFDTTHLAGTLERVFGAWIAVEIQAGRLTPVPLPGLAHDQSLRV